MMRFKMYNRLKLGHWAFVIVFMAIVLLYDDSIQISKKAIQTLVCAIASMTRAI